MTRRFTISRLAAATILLTAPVLGVAAATPAAAASCDGVEVTALTSTSCIEVGESQALPIGPVTFTNKTDAALRLRVFVLGNEQVNQMLEPEADFEFNGLDVAEASVELN
ncbi:hypothetical protein ACWD1Z_37680 [Streptomyces sp. NPDC002784]